MKNQATGLNRFREYLTNSKNNANPPAYYNLTATTSTHDRDVFEEMDDDVHYRCALLDYEGNKISCIYWCICYKYVSEDITICFKFPLQASGRSASSNQRNHRFYYKWRTLLHAYWRHRQRQDLLNGKYHRKAQYPNPHNDTQQNPCRAALQRV